MEEKERGARKGEKKKREREKEEKKERKKKSYLEAPRDPFGLDHPRQPLPNPSVDLFVALDLHEDLEALERGHGGAGAVCWSGGFFFLRERGRKGGEEVEQWVRRPGFFLLFPLCSGSTQFFDPLGALFFSFGLQH